MPKLSSHQSAKTTKLLLIGDSGTGKTGSLASLAEAGYKLRILDLDNGLDVLKHYLTNPASPYVKAKPDVAAQVDFCTITDPMVARGGKLFPAKAVAWQRAMDHLMDWCDPPKWEKAPEGTTRATLGPITSWDTDAVLVIDSLSFLSTNAFNHHLAVNGKLGADLTQNEWRRAIGQAQQQIRSFLELIYDASVKCNVILTAHITFVSEAGERPDDSHPGTGYPSAIGRALSPHIPRYFNTVLQTRSIGSGPSTRRVISTQPVGMVNLKSTAPLKAKPEYPLTTGLADYFKAVREP